MTQPTDQRAGAVVVGALHDELANRDNTVAHSKKDRPILIPRCIRRAWFTEPRETKQ